MAIAAMARRAARWVLWVIKAALAVVAVAALLAWPWSYGRPGEVARVRATVEPSGRRVRERYIAACARGRLGAGHFTYIVFGYGRRAISNGEGEVPGFDWRWEVSASTDVPDVSDYAESFGPVSWEQGGETGGGAASFVDTLSVPCWLVALVAGAWPVGIVVLAARRYRRTSRRLRLGLCCECGYDLRATAAADEELLAVCPECGRAARLAARR
jgi:hypothetical protein